MESVCGWCFKCHGSRCRDRHNYPGSNRLEYSFRLGFKASNNEAEYEAFIVRLRITFDLGACDMEVYSDS